MNERQEIEIIKAIVKACFNKPYVVMCPSGIVYAEFREYLDSFSNLYGLYKRANCNITGRNTPKILKKLFPTIYNDINVRSCLSNR